MEYKITVKCIRNNHRAFVALEAKFRKMLEEIAVSEGAESMEVVKVNWASIWELEDSFKLVEYFDKIKAKDNE